jgi:hypothetical protein
MRSGPAPTTRHNAPGLRRPASNRPGLGAMSCSASCVLRRRATARRCPKRPSRKACAGFRMRLRRRREVSRTGQAPIAVEGVANSDAVGLPARHVEDGAGARVLGAAACHKPASGQRKGAGDDRRPDGQGEPLGCRWRCCRSCPQGCLAFFRERESGVRSPAYLMISTGVRMNGATNFMTGCAAKNFCTALPISPKRLLERLIVRRSLSAFSTILAEGLSTRSATRCASASPVSPPLWLGGRRAVISSWRRAMALKNASEA